MVFFFNISPIASDEAAHKQTNVTLAFLVQQKVEMVGEQGKNNQPNRRKALGGFVEVPSKHPKVFLFKED